MIISAVVLAGPVHSSYAGPQYVDETGFAVSGYDVVAYHDLEQVPVAEPKPEAVPGRASITAEYNGAQWAFASRENRDRFLADPEKYAPRFDGHCAYGVAKGGKVPGNPNLWRIVDGELHLNITPSVVNLFEQDISGNVSKAGRNWNTLESAEASSGSWRSISENDGTYSTEAPLND
jgi:YHS domain-containing protein